MITAEVALDMGARWFSQLRWRQSVLSIRINRRGTVSLLAAFSLPVWMGIMALGIDVSYWAVERIQLQGIADVAALAGAMRYAETSDASAAVQTAAHVAEINGTPANPGTPTTGGNTTSLTDNYGSWTATYSLNEATQTLTATIQAGVPVWFGGIFTGATTQLISASAAAQVSTSIGGHPCILTLNTGNNSFTTTGTAQVASTACGIRSDGGISEGKNGLNVPSVIESGTSAISCSQASCVTEKGVPADPDPFSNPYGALLTSGAPSGTPVQSTTSSSSSTCPSDGKTYPAYNPGAYPNGLPSGSYVLNSGVYYITGTFNLSGGAFVCSGTGGVTIISTGGFNFSGNSTVALTAMSTGETAGLLFGTTATAAGAVTFTGTSGSTVNGAIYVPNGGVTFTGTSATFNSGGTCLSIVSSTMTLTGTTNLSVTNSGCEALGTPTLYYSSALTKLVQ